MATSSSLEEFIKITVHKSVEELLKAEGLFLRSKGLTSLPTCIEQLTKLIRIRLTNNKLSSLPPSFGRLTSLEGVYLNNNELSSLPESIGQLTKMTKLDVGMNMLSALPISIKELTSLQELKINSNLISSLPESIGQLSNLAKLWLHDNPMTELPFSITKLSNLADLVIVDSSGEMSIKILPLGIKILPCYIPNERIFNKLLDHNQDMFSDSEKSSPLLRLRQRAHEKKSPVVAPLLSQKDKNINAPILFSNETKVTEMSELACINGVLCLMCLKFISDPCILECKHAFCSLCITGAIQKSGLRPPFSCPICYQPSIESDEISDSMKQDAEILEKESEIITKQISNPDYVAIKCINSDCNENATHYCSKCDVFCSRHFKSHKEAYGSSHDSLVSELKPGCLPIAIKLSCQHHKNLPVRYYCTECPAKPFKCAECHAEDHRVVESGQKIHKYIQYRESDAHEFQRILQIELDQLKNKLQATECLKNMLDEERTTFIQSCDKLKQQVKAFTDELQTLVDNMKLNLRKQVDNIETEQIRELQSKYSELRADEERLKLASKLISDTMEHFSEMKPAEINNILALSMELNKTPTKDIVLRPLRLIQKIPSFLLSELEVLSKQLLVGAQVDDSAVQQTPDSTRKVEIKGHFIFDQETKQYFGISEGCSKIVVIDRDIQIMRMISPHSYLNQHIHNLQGIALSKTGLIAIADECANTVSIYDKATMSLGFVLRGSAEDRASLFDSPCDVAYNSKGHLFVLDSGSKTILVFDENFCFYHKIDLKKLGIDIIENNPRMIEIGPLDGLHVYCLGSDSVLEFDQDFNTLPSNSFI